MDTNYPTSAEWAASAAQSKIDRLEKRVIELEQQVKALTEALHSISMSLLTVADNTKHSPRL